MKSFKCPSCGAPMKAGEEKCNYCGAYVVREEEKEEKKEKPSQNWATNLFDGIQNFINGFKVKPDFSIVLFVILMIVFFPAGIIYLLINLDSDKKS